MSFLQTSRCLSARSPKTGIASLSCAGRLHEEPSQRGQVLKDVYDSVSEKLAMEVDSMFLGAVETLKAVAPNFKVWT